MAGSIISYKFAKVKEEIQNCCIDFYLHRIIVFSFARILLIIWPLLYTDLTGRKGMRNPKS